MHRLAFVLCCGLVACESARPDTELPPPDETWDLTVVRALPVVPSAFSVLADGPVIVLRTSDGLSRSLDGGQTFAPWTTKLTVAVLPFADGTAWQVRNLGRHGEEDLVFDHLSREGVATGVPNEVSWGEGSRWVSATLHRGETRHYLQAFGRFDDVTLAATKLFEVDPVTRALTEIALPREVAPGSLWMVAQSGTTLAVATLDGDTTFLALRDGDSWREVEAMDGIIDLVATDDGAFVVSRVVEGESTLVRLHPTEAAMSRSVDAAFSLARGHDGRLVAVSRSSVAPFSQSGKVLLESRDGGRTWETLATSLEATTAFDSRVAVASTGLWTIDGPFVTWRPDDGRHWRLAGLSSEISVPFLQARDDEVWMVTYRATQLLTPDGGNNLFRSFDRGVTWQFAGGIGVAVNCFALAPDFLFFAGPGDVRGAPWETRDLTGRRVIRNDRIVLAENQRGGELDVVACASSGGPSITVSQAPVGNLPGVMHGVNLQHQTFDEAILWQKGRQVPDHRFTALDGEGGALGGAAERYYQGPGGLTPEPYTTFYDSAMTEWVFTLDVTRPQRGARAASRVHRGIFVYPTGEMYVGYKKPESITGLDEGYNDDAFIRDAFLDTHEVLWIATDRGLFRDASRAPIAPPAPTGCDVDRDCAGFAAGGDLCAPTTRCLDGQCVPRPRVTCEHMPLAASCRVWECAPATGECIEVVADDFDYCGRPHMCEEPGRCESGVCVPGGPVVCPGATECAPTACSPATGCFKDYLPAGAVCGVADACDVSGRCTGRFDDCVGAAELGCDDGNACTQDVCDPVNGCVFTPTRQGLACNDGNACTSNDRCDEGTCQGAPANEGAACDDGEPCTSDTTCQAGVCAGGVEVEGSCDDGDPCTTGETCDEGGCVAGTSVACADDGNPCTSDACVPGLGCVYAPTAEGESCGYGDACQADGVCQAGWCVGGAKLADGARCDSGRSCVADEACQDGRCGGGEVALSGGCDDGLACTTNDRCEAGFCVGQVDGESCEGIAACEDCSASTGPAGPALVVTWASSNTRTSGVMVLSLGGALISNIEISEVGMLYGVVHDRAHGDGFWVTSDVTTAERSIWKIGWDGEVIEKLAIVGGPANQDFLGGLDHVPAKDGLPEVLLIKSGVSLRRLTIVDRSSGTFLAQYNAFGTGQAVWVEDFAATTQVPSGRPIWWTGDFVATRQVITRVEDNVQTWVTPFPTGDAVAGMTREPNGGAFWLATHQFDSRVVRLMPDGRRTHAFEVPLGAASGPGSPRVFDIDLWPGRDVF